MRIIGLTGGISTGKSTVSQILTEQQLPVIDADLIARQVVAPGSPGHRRIVAALGAANVLDPVTGNIDRPKLGSLVFRDPEARRKVNHATHPYIRLEMLRQLLWAFLCLKRVVVLDTPLLFEAGIDNPESIQKTRLIKRDDLTEETAQQRIDAQMSIERKRQMAHIVIDNSQGIRETRKRVLELLPDLKPSLFSTWIAWGLLAWPAAMLYSLLTVVKVLKL
ncbi:hypothetical protein HDU76_003710 [Blyttiomyces sp. JEL0837]|nr:hypothetical protein HDU76_003710 [Blyttiomyces sp. JEL0837]